MKRAVPVLAVWILVAEIFICLSARAQTVLHNQVVNTPNGEVFGLFEVTGGVVTPVPTGLVTNNFPSLSSDGRFISISAPDPQFPDEASDDLWEFDRFTQQTRKVIDSETMTQPDGSIFFSSPLFSALSPDNQLIAVATQLGAVPGGGLPRTLTVHRASDGFNVSLAEIGNGSAIDFFQSEFLGISWSPDGTVFASPAYVNVITNTGRQTVAAGIVLFGFDPATLTYIRVGQVTTPQVIDTPAPGIIIETHALPVFSPDGQRLAFFSITYPDPFLVEPATAELWTINADGTNRTSLLQFDPGFYPVGLSWTSDGNQLVFSIAEQVQNNGFHSPLPVPSTAVLRLISASGGIPSPIAGAPAGFFPNVVPIRER